MMNQYLVMIILVILLHLIVNDYSLIVEARGNNGGGNRRRRQQQQRAAQQQAKERKLKEEINKHSVRELLDSEVVLGNNEEFIFKEKDRCVKMIDFYVAPGTSLGIKLKKDSSREDFYSKILVSGIDEKSSAGGSGLVKEGDYILRIGPEIVHNMEIKQLALTIKDQRERNDGKLQVMVSSKECKIPHSLDEDSIPPPPLEETEEDSAVEEDENRLLSWFDVEVPFNPGTPLGIKIGAGKNGGLPVIEEIVSNFDLWEAKKVKVGDLISRFNKREIRNAEDLQAQFKLITARVKSGFTLSIRFSRYLDTSEPGDNPVYYEIELPRIPNHNRFGLDFVFKQLEDELKDARNVNNRQNNRQISTLAVTETPNEHILPGDRLMLFSATPINNLSHLDQLIRRHRNRQSAVFRFLRWIPNAINEKEEKIEEVVEDLKLKDNAMNTDDEEDVPVKKIVKEADKAKEEDATLKEEESVETVEKIVEEKETKPKNELLDDSLGSDESIDVEKGKNVELSDKEEVVEEKQEDDEDQITIKQMEKELEEKIAAAKAKAQKQQPVVSKKEKEEADLYSEDIEEVFEDVDIKSKAAESKEEEEEDAIDELELEELEAQKELEEAIKKAEEAKKKLELKKKHKLEEIAKEKERQRLIEIKRLEEEKKLLEEEEKLKAELKRLEEEEALKRRLAEQEEKLKQKKLKQEKLKQRRLELELELKKLESENNKDIVDAEKEEDEKEEEEEEDDEGEEDDDDEDYDEDEVIIPTPTEKPISFASSILSSAKSALGFDNKNEQDVNILKDELQKMDKSLNLLIDNKINEYFEKGDLVNKVADLIVKKLDKKLDKLIHNQQKKDEL